MKFVLSINCDNDAFQPEPLPEIAAILRRLASKLEQDGTTGLYENISDANGNIVGTYKLIKE